MIPLKVILVSFFTFLSQLKTVHATAPFVDYPKCYTSGISYDSRPNQVGDTVTITCESRGGQPAASLQWMRDNVVQNAVYSVDDKYFKATSIISWSLTPNDNGATFVCTETHMELSQPRNCQVNALQVVYLPVVSVAPQSIMANIGDSPSFLCTTHGNPAVRSGSHQWYFNDNTEVPDSTRYVVVQTPDGGLLLSVLSIQQSDFDVDIKCKATNSMGTTSTKALLLPVTTMAPPTTTTTTTTTAAATTAAAAATTTATTTTTTATTGTTTATTTNKPAETNATLITGTTNVSGQQHQVTTLSSLMSTVPKVQSGTGVDDGPGIKASDGANVCTVDITLITAAYILVKFLSE